MLRCVWQALNSLSIHVTFTAIVPEAFPGEAKMCLRLSWRSPNMFLRLIAETDARSVGDSHPSCYFSQPQDTSFILIYWSILCSAFLRSCCFNIVCAHTVMKSAIHAMITKSKSYLFLTYRYIFYYRQGGSAAPPVLFLLFNCFYSGSRLFSVFRPSVATRCTDHSSSWVSTFLQLLLFFWSTFSVLYHKKCIWAEWTASRLQSRVCLSFGWREHGRKRKDDKRDATWNRSQAPDVAVSCDHSNTYHDGMRCGTHASIGPCVAASAAALYSCLYDVQ